MVSRKAQGGGMPEGDMCVMWGGHEMAYGVAHRATKSVRRGCWTAVPEVLG